MRQVVRHGRVDLAVRHSGPPEPGRPHLLVLHALYGSGDDWVPIESAWPGTFSALDFSGHGASDWIPGRAYSPELFAADADVVLAEIEDAAPLYLAGAGVGAYAALLLAGARPGAFRATLLLPGAGLAGGGARPEAGDAEDAEQWRALMQAPGRRPGEPGPDPLVARCERDVRPPDYAEAFAKALANTSHALRIAAPEPWPPWLDAARAHGLGQSASPDPREALAALARM